MAEQLAELFSSRVRAALLALLLSRPHLAFSLTELSRRLGLPVSSLQHECYKLTRLGLLRDERVGNARLYRPNPAWPLIEPLTALVVCAMAPMDALQGAIEGVPGLDECWIAGALDGNGPLYLVVVGELGLDEVDGLFARVRVIVGAAATARLELAFLRPRDWSDRLVAGNPFATSLLAEPRLEARIATVRMSAPSTELA